MKLVSLKLALPAAILAMAFSAARGEEEPPLQRKRFRPKYNFAAPATGHRGKVSKELFPYPV